MELIGRLRDTLDPLGAAPLTPAPAAEFDRREAAADASPDEGDAWPEIRDELRKKLRQVRPIRVRETAGAERAGAE